MEKLVAYNDIYSCRERQLDFFVAFFCCEKSTAPNRCVGVFADDGGTNFCVCACKRNQSFVLSCKKSAVIFLQYPLITFVLVFVQVVFRLTALFSYFLFPTWILAEVLFLIFFKFYEKFTNKKYKK